MKHTLLLLLCGFLLNGCVKNNPLPVWLEITEWSLVNNPDMQEGPGYLSHNFSEAWIYVDNKLIGVFEVPCKIPVLNWGNGKVVRIYPAIKNNGIASKKKIYPFVKAFEQTYDLVEGQTIHIDAVTMYEDNALFWLEDFEGSQPKFATDDNYSNASSVIENNAGISISGKYMHVAMNQTDSLWRGVMTEIVGLPQAAEVYLEIDYRTDVPVLQGVFGISSDGSSTDNPYIQLNAQSAGSTNWKKIYLDLREIVSYSTSAVGFKMYLRALLPELQSTGDIYIDNLRLVHF